MPMCCAGLYLPQKDAAWDFPPAGSHHHTAETLQPIDLKHPNNREPFTDMLRLTDLLCH